MVRGLFVRLEKQRKRESWKNWEMIKTQVLKQLPGAREEGEKISEERWGKVRVSGSLRAKGNLKR